MNPLLSGGGKSVAVGAAALLLTEYAPVTIINISTTRVWVADNSGVGPQNGVPVDPGTALPWKTEGELWAVLDPAASGSATVVLTNGVDNWSPSPATIASQVASALLAGGVPNVFNNTLLAFRALGTDLAPGAHFDLDVHAYASLNLQSVSTGNVGSTSLRLDFYQESAAGNSSPITEYLTNVDKSVQAEWVLPISAGSVRITNYSGASVGVIVYGSNRPIPSAQQLGSQALPRSFGATIAGTVNVPIPLVANDGLSQSTTFNRSTQINFAASQTGNLQYKYALPDSSTRLVTILTYSNTGSQAVSAPFSHPLVPILWQFVPFATASTTYGLSIAES